MKFFFFNLFSISAKSLPPSLDFSAGEPVLTALITLGGDWLSDFFSYFVYGLGLDIHFGLFTACYTDRSENGDAGGPWEGLIPRGGTDLLLGVLGGCAD